MAKNVLATLRTALMLIAHLIVSHPSAELLQYVRLYGNAYLSVHY